MYTAIYNIPALSHYNLCLLDAVCNLHRYLYVVQLSSIGITNVWSRCCYWSAINAQQEQPVERGDTNYNGDTSIRSSHVTGEALTLRRGRSPRVGIPHHLSSRLVMWEGVGQTTVQARLTVHWIQRFLSSPIMMKLLYVVSGEYS
jgi:hypothetical protein